MSNGEIVVAGEFRWAGGVRVDGLGIWDGSKWNRFPGWTDSMVRSFCYSR